MALIFRENDNNPRRPSTAQYVNQWVEGLNRLGNTFQQNNQYADQRRRQALMDAITQQQAQNQQIKFGQEQADYNRMNEPIQPYSPQATPGPYSPDYKPSVIDHSYTTGFGIPPGMSRRDYGEQMGYREKEAEIGLKEAQAKKALMEPNYVIPTYDANGNVVGFTNAPIGAKVVGGGKPAPQKNNPMASPSEAQSIIDEINRVQELNKNSYGGFLGNLQMKAKSALNLGQDDTTFKNTADVINTMQQQVARVLKSTFGGQLSDAEREYLNNVYGALPKISQTERDIAMTNVKRMLSSKLQNPQQSGIVNTVQTGNTGGKIRVRNRQTGQVGSISEKFFDPNKYERL